MNYESRSQRLKFYSVFKKGALTLLICFLVVFPMVEYWEMYERMQDALRSGKNVLLNMELISLEYFGLGRTICDLSRKSGMTAGAEEKVILFSGAKGEFRLEEWDNKKHVVLRMTYEQDGFILRYERLSEEKIAEKELAGDPTTGEWKIYRQTRRYDAK